MEIKAAINEQAKDEEARKIRLEEQFKPSIKSLFTRMIQAFQALYISTGQIVDFNNFDDEWRAALKSQYRRVGREFSSNARKSEYIRDLLIKQDDDELTIEEIAALAAAYLAFSQGRATSQTSFIIETSNTNARESVQESIREFREDNPFREPTNEEIARSASKKLRKKFTGRVSTIANMQTQSPAEEAKRLEALALSKRPLLPFQPITDIPKPVTKQWADVNLPDVRASHAEANGQRVDIDDVFIVQGQMLKYPGDSSLGATIDNTANCRCSSIMQIGK